MSVFILEEKFELVSEASNVKIFLIDETDLEKNEDGTLKKQFSGVDILEVEGAYGEISDHSLYLADMKSKTYVFKFNVEKLKKSNSLDIYEAGEKHISMICGGMLTSHLISEKYFKLSDVIEFIPSEALVSKVNIDRSFLTGLRIKSVSNKLKFKESTKPAEKRKLNVTNLIDEQNIEASNNHLDAMILSKSLVNTPANFLNPETYEQFAIDYITELKESGHPVDIEVYDKSKLQNDGAGLILAVGAGSNFAPRIIKLTYTPESAKKHIALVGKGITYDTGGLNIKPGSAMRHMKKDMGGSAAVLGSFALSVLNGYENSITAYLAIAENMISASSARPGDVYVALNGKSVEIDNTDAEGRLVLADALTYASKEGSDVLIDIATLTGAARVSLGTQVDVCLSNNLELSEQIHKASIETGDWVWRQPRVEPYYSALDSKVASMENTGGRFGGAITAGMFLERFHNSKNWIHIDTWMWAEKPTTFTKEAGACPKIVTFMEELLENIAK